MKIVCYGDSNTFGYDPRGSWGGRYDSPWPDILSRNLKCTVINRGENGRKVPVKTVDFPMDTDLLIVMLGTNDLLQGASPEYVCHNMAQFLESLDIDWEKILLIAPPSMKSGAWVPDHKLIDNSKSLAALYKSIAKRLSMLFLDAGQWRLQMAYDGVHLTEKDHMIFADKVSEILLNIMNATGG